MNDKTPEKVTLLPRPGVLARRHNTVWLLAVCLMGLPGARVDADESGAQETSENRLLGQRSFIRCRACHTLGEGEPHKVGPNLHGMFGRKAGASDGFNYSEALESSDIVWDETTLRQWLLAPAELIPGNTMAFVGLPGEKELTALIAYLYTETE